MTTVAIERLVTQREDLELKIQINSQMYGEGCDQVQYLQIELETVEKKLNRHFLIEVYKL